MGPQAVRGLGGRELCHSAVSVVDKVLQEEVEFREK